MEDADGQVLGVSRQFSWRWWPRGKNKSADDAELSFEQFEGGDRRQLLQALSAVVGGGALAAMSQPAEAKDASELPPPKRALTGRDEAGKSVFKSFDVTLQGGGDRFQSGTDFLRALHDRGRARAHRPGAGPDAAGTKAFPGPGGTMFRLISYPPRRPEGYKPPPGVTFESALKELSDKVPGMGDHFDAARRACTRRTPSTTGSWFAAR